MYWHLLLLLLLLLRLRVTLDSDAVHVALRGEDGASPRGQVLWLVADDVRRGRALNAVRVAECLMRDSEIG